MKPRYKIGETVRIKATGEKVNIIAVTKWLGSYVYYFKGLTVRCEESELKPYRPSRTGKFRNKKGQFISALDKAAQEQRNHFDYTERKLGTYEKILTTLDRIEKKIDELRRKV